jgi:protoporphyrinogen oxidase
MKARVVVPGRARVGIVGGGMLGLTLAYRLAKLGHQVQLFESAPELGGLAASHDYGPFQWDRFYHCILPQDRHLIGLLEHLGLAGELRWRQTGTGYYARGRWFPMSRSIDYLKFPLLSWIDKARVGATVVYATLAADPRELYSVSAEQWLVRWCGRRGYEAFWRPLLRAKFGPFHDQVAAVFIWATLTRLFGARSGAASKEKLGYVRGGYRTILGRLERELLALGAILHKGTPVTAIRRAAVSRAAGEARSQCEVHYGEPVLGERATFDHVFFTGPTRLARQVVDASLMPAVERAESDHPAAAAYLGVACLVLAMKRRLTPFYVLNVGDERIELTGVIEMTNLVDRNAETAGLSLVYVPQYMDSEDPRLSADDGAIERGLVDKGLMPMFPDLSRREFVYHRVHRAKLVQPLPLVRHVAPAAALVSRTCPLQVLNTSMLTCATLNNDEVVSFVDRFLQMHKGLEGAGSHMPPSRIGPIDVFPNATTRAS